MDFYYIATGADQTKRQIYVQISVFAMIVRKVKLWIDVQVVTSGLCMEHIFFILIIQTKLLMATKNHDMKWVL